MHPAFALARKRLLETRAEFTKFLAADEEMLVPMDSNVDSRAAWVRTVSRASGIEGVYTGMEGVIKEVLSITDAGGVMDSGSWHAQLLAQAAEATDDRNELISNNLYNHLDELRGFRHRERANYRFVLKENLVNENLALLKSAFPLFEEEVLSFITDWEKKPEDDGPPSRSP